MSQSHTDRVLTGLALRLFAIACLSTMSALIKLAETRGAGLVETMFHRQLWAVPLVTAWIAAGPGLGSIRTRRFGAHLSRTAVGLTGMVFTFGSVLLLPLAEATTLQFTVPIFATILGALVLKEPTGWHRWGAVIVGFLGVLVVAQPGGGHFPLYGAVVGLLAALFVAIVAILLRQIGKTESAGTTVFWFSTLSVLPLGAVYAFQLKAHDPLTWAILVAIGLVGGVGQLALTGAVRFAPVSAVVPMDYSGLVWATLYGWLLFGVLPTPYTWMGAPIIIASGLYIVYREQRLRRSVSPVTAAETPA
ncbi:DMT family transporter [Sphingomonas sp. JC676]|uniref:DMT family transporter n=1 Tax=Sphingomonas sp. JC676 TaxID=2768065 RepID=UPI0016583C49|nr:DMT family transporter [Sphingomonas sp. JC676]MBC9032820.1 DMT family transporter [Sphingomonas sp. JC676]